MPASMIKPEVGSRWKVSGNSMAMVAIGPMPGRTPIKVPISAPASAKNRFAGVSATPNPTARLWRISIYHSGQTGMVNPSPRMKMPQERRMSTSAAARVSNGRSPRAATDQQEDRTPEPEPLDAEAEDHQACGDEHEGPQCRNAPGRKRPRVLRLAQPLHEHDNPEPEEEPAQQPRHVTGAHAQRGP